MQKVIKNKSILSLIILLILMIVTIATLGRILIPFIIAMILTYILNPLVEKINHKFQIKRSLVSFIIALIVFLLLLTIPLCIIPSFIIELKLILSKVPNLILLFNSHVLQAINEKYGTNMTLDFQAIKTLVIQNIHTFYNNINLFSPLAKNSFRVIELMAYIVLIPFILFYTITNWKNIINFFDTLIPIAHKHTVRVIARDLDLMLSSYLRGQISVMLIMAIFYATTLKLISLPGGVVVGLITGLLVFIPYLGLLCGFIICLTIGFAEFTNLNHIYAIIIVFGIGHTLESSFITPFLVGGKIGLNPVLIILALLAFGQILGFVGILLALPLSAITVVLLKHAKNYYLNSNYYNEIN